MGGQLFIRLDSPSPGQASWMVEGENTVSGEGRLTGAAALASGRRVIVLVPGTDVLLVQAAVPTRKRERVLQAIPFALEDQLAGDVERLHFAIARRSNGQAAVPVAVTARTRMDQWMDELGAAGITPHALIPDTLALPFAPGTWTVLREARSALMRHAPFGALACDPENLSYLLERTVGEAGESLPERIRVIDCTAQSTSPAHTSFPLDREDCGAGALSWLILGYRAGETIDLLQGPYSHRERLGQLWRPWRAAVALAAVWLALLGGLSVAHYQRLAVEEDGLRTQVNRIFLEAFPDARKVVDPRAQTEQRLAALRGQQEGSGSPFLTLLNRAGPVLGKTEDLTLRRLHYSDGTLDLDLVIPDLQGLDHLAQSLREAPLEVEIRSARAQGGHVEAHLVVREPRP